MVDHLFRPGPIVGHCLQGATASFPLRSVVSTHGAMPKQSFWETPHTYILQIEDFEGLSFYWRGPLSRGAVSEHCSNDAQALISLKPCTGQGAISATGDAPLNLSRCSAAVSRTKMLHARGMSEWIC